MSRKKHRRKRKGSKKPMIQSDSDAADIEKILAEEGRNPEAPIDSDETNLDPPSNLESSPAFRLPGFFSGTLELPKDKAPWPVVIGLILIAYALSVYVRLPWIDMATGKYCPAPFESVASIGISNPGKGYAVEDVVTISDGRGAGATAKISSVGGNGEITGVTLTAAGSGYVTTPNATITSDAGKSGLLAVRLLNCGSTLQENESKCSRCGAKRSREAMRWEGYPTPNTHDSFYFAAILQKAHLGMHQENDMIPSVVQNGMLTTFSYGLLKLFPSLTIEQLLLWVTVFVSGLVCIPVVLIGRLYGSAVWGFFAACIAGVAHSYFNRTLAGYYDTDVFSVTAAVFALMFLLAALRRRSMGFALAGALACFLYPFFYNRTSIPIAMGIGFIGFQFIQTLRASIEREDKGSDRWLNLGGHAMICIYFAWAFGVTGVFGNKLEGLIALLFLVTAVAVPAIQSTWLKVREKDEKAESLQELEANIGFAWRSSILVGVGIAASAYSGGTELERSTIPFMLTLVALVGLYFIFSRVSIRERVLAGSGLAALLIWIIVSNPLQVVFDPAARSTEAKNTAVDSSRKPPINHALNFRNTFGTVREGGAISWATTFTRITATFKTGSDAASSFHFPVAVLALIGYGVLVLRHWEFLIALPFIGIGLYAHWGGLRYTVHATAVAALGLTFLTVSLAWAAARLANFRWNKVVTWIFCAAATCFFVWPNVEHANAYTKTIDVVFPKGVIESLKTLEKTIKEDSAENDGPAKSPFVVTWWDYGSGTWLYSGCRTFTSPAHHAERGADNFLVSQILSTSSQAQAANLSRLMTEEAVQISENNKQHKKGYQTTSRSLFQDGTPNLVFYPKLFESAKSSEFELPTKTRETYLFLHYETLRIFSTIAGFSQRNLFAPEKSEKPSVEGGIRFYSPYGVLLRKPVRKEDNTISFANGSFLDAKGNFHMKAGGGPAGIVPILLLKNAGEPRSSKQSLLLDGKEHPVVMAKKSGLIMVHATNPDRVFLMDINMMESLLVRKYLLDQYDEEIVGHPGFEQLFNRTEAGQNYFLALVGSRIRDKKVELIQRSKQGYLSMSIDTSTRLAELYGSPLVGDGSISNPLRSSKGRQVPFSLHQVEYDFEEGEPKMVRIKTDSPELFQHSKAQKLKLTAPEKTSDPRHHAIQFLYIGASAQKGFDFTNMWLFIHDDLFRSTVIQGFVFENLDPEFFEPVDLSPWSKIYRVNR